MTIQFIGSLIGCGLVVALVFYGSLMLEREAAKLKSERHGDAQTKGVL